MICFKASKFIFLFLVVINVNSRGRERYVEFLTDMISQLKHSNKVISFLCWKRGDLNVLSKRFSQNFISHGLLSTNPNKYRLYNGNKVFVLNMYCEGSVEQLTEALKSNLFDSTSVWIIFGELDVIKSYNFYFPINSLVYVVEKKDHLHFSVKIIYKNNKADLVYVEIDVAEWHLQERFLYFNKFFLSTNRSDLLGSPIRVSYVVMHNNTLNHLWDYRNTHTDILTRANYGIISHVLELLNASKVDIWTNTWGYRNETSNIINGMYGDLILDRADIAGTAGFMQTTTQKHFKFIPPINTMPTMFIFQAPPLSYTADIFSLTFTRMVFVTYISLMIFSAILFYYVSIFEWKQSLKTNNRTCKPTVSDVLFLECLVAIQRSISWELKSLPGKLVLFFTFTLCTYMYIGFSAYILVLLQSTSESITDLASLYDSEMEMGVEDMAFSRYYFSTPNEYSNETLRRMILENRIVPKNNWFSARDGLERVRKGFFAFHIQTGKAFSLLRYSFTEKEKCKIRTTPTILHSTEVSLVVPKSSVYTEIFLVGFRRIFETGLQRRDHIKFYATYFAKPHCTGRHGNYDSVRLMDCYSPFLYFSFGLLLSCLVLICEILWVKFYSKLE